MSGAVGAVAAFGGAPGIIALTLLSGSNVGSCDWQLDNNGGGHTGDGAGGAAPMTWVSPSTTAVAAFYEVKVDVTSGAFTTGTTGSYLSLGTTRGWAKTVVGSVTFNATFREIATGIIRRSITGLTVVVS